MVQIIRIEMKYIKSEYSPLKTEPLHVDPPTGPAQGESTQTPEEFADDFITLPSDFMMDLGTVDPQRHGTEIHHEIAG